MTGIRKVLNIFAFIAMVLMNILSETLPINGVTSGQVSDMYASLFTPAGITFAIWAVIYIMLGYFTLWQVLWAKSESVDRIGMTFVVSCALNMAWLLLWHFKMIYLATAVIIALLFVLNKLKNIVAGENWLVKATFGTYLAWITVASIASVFIIAGQLFKNFAFSVLAQILVWVVACAVVYLVYRRLKDAKDIAYALTMIWALAGIGYKHIASTGFAGAYMHIIVGIVLTIIAISLLIARRTTQGGVNYA